MNKILSYVHRKFVWLEPVLLSINYPFTYDIFISTRLLLTILISIFSVLIILILQGKADFPILLNIPLSIVDGVIIGLITFRLLTTLPLMKRYILRSSIQSYLPYTLMILSIYAAGGYPITGILLNSSRIIKENSTKAIIERVIADLEKGEGIEDSLLKESIACPSPDLRSVLKGLASISTSGVGTLAFLKNSLDNYLKRLDSKLREKIDKISVIMEGYIAIGVLFPLLIEVILLFFANQLPVGIPPEALIIVFFFILIPVLFVSTIIIIDSVMSEVKL
jgi:hypothetical protein